MGELVYLQDASDALSDLQVRIQQNFVTVSYTHLDVYKRQTADCLRIFVILSTVMNSLESRDTINMMRIRTNSSP